MKPIARSSMTSSLPLMLPRDEASSLPSRAHTLSLCFRNNHQVSSIVLFDLRILQRLGRQCLQESYREKEKGREVPM